MNNAIPAVWKKDAELGIAYFCSKCHRFVLQVIVTVVLTWI